MKGSGYYKVLSVGKAADRSEIRDSYIELMRIYHPDNYYRRADEDLLDLLEEAYQLITVAYETLIDRERRAIYDDEIRNFDAPSADGGQLRAQRIRARSFEKRNPRMAKLAARLVEESQTALDDLKFIEAARKAKLALSYHPHMVEAQELLRTLEQEGHSG
jgi:DnaJ-class molecular chaperone